MSDATDGQDVVTFSRTLESDVSTDESLKHLLAIQLINETFNMFDLADMRGLAKVLTVLNFQKGEQIIEKGEGATFAGIIIEGQFNAIVSETQTFPLKRGDIVGEMAYFEYVVDRDNLAARNADIVTASPTSTLAVISYEEMDTLGNVDPLLAQKLTHMLAATSLQKNKAQIARLSGNNQPTKPVKTGLSSAKKELLYRARLKKASADVAATAQRSKEAIEIVSKKMHTYEHQLVNLQKRYDVMKQDYADTMRECRRAQQEEARLAEKCEEQANSNAYMIQKNRDALTTQGSLQVQVRMLTKNMETIRDELASKFQQDTADLQKELAAMHEKNSDMQSALDSHRQQVNSHRSSAAESALDRDTLHRTMKELQETHSSTLKDHSRMSVEKEELQLSLSSHIQTKKQLTERLEQLSFDLREEVARREKCEATITEERNQLAVERAYTQRQLDDARSQNLRTQTLLADYRTILKYFAVTQFVKRFRLCQQLRAVSDKLQFLTTEVVGEVSRHSSHPPDDATVLATAVAERRRYAQEMRQRALKVMPSALCAALQDRVLATVTAVWDALRQVRNWKATADSFFQRNIELTHNCLGNEQQLSQQHTRLRAARADNQNQKSQLLQLVALLQQAQIAASLAGYGPSFEELHANSGNSDGGSGGGDGSGGDGTFNALDIDLSGDVNAVDLSRLPLYAGGGGHNTHTHAHALNSQNREGGGGAGGGGHTLANMRLGNVNAGNTSNVAALSSSSPSSSSRFPTLSSASASPASGGARQRRRRRRGGAGNNNSGGSEGVSNNGGGGGGGSSGGIGVANQLYYPPGAGGSDRGQSHLGRSQQLSASSSSSSFASQGRPMLSPSMSSPQRLSAAQAATGVGGPLMSSQSMTMTGHLSNTSNNSFSNSYQNVAGSVVVGKRSSRQQQQQQQQQQPRQTYATQFSSGGRPRPRGM